MSWQCAVCFRTRPAKEPPYIIGEKTGNRYCVKCVGPPPPVVRCRLCEHVLSRGKP